MRALAIILLAAVSIFAQSPNVVIQTLPEAIYVENMAGNLNSVERVFFHIVIHNTAPDPVDILWARFDIVNSEGSLLSAQYSGASLTALFDSAIERRRIEPTAKQTLVLG